MISFIPDQKNSVRVTKIRKKSLIAAFDFYQFPSVFR